MPLDDLALFLQRRLDRLVRRLRVGPPPPRGRPHLLVVQIDGLSRTTLERALADGTMPFVARLLARHRHRLVPMAVGMPTSTPAFQMSAMYGVRPDIPGFHYHDKRARADVYFPRPGHAARVEAQQAAGRAGILAGGSSYGCVFTGGAEHTIFTFARLTRPTGRGVVRALAAGVVLAWVVVKSTAQTVVELTRSLLALIAHPVHDLGRHWRWMSIKIGISVWLRELFTLSVARDLYAGVPAVYVNYLDYDVAAHAFGPRSRRARRALRRVDRAIRQLWRVARRVPELAWDVYVLSDHGQAECRPYHQLTGQSFHRHVVEELLGVPGAGTDAAGEDDAAGHPGRALGSYRRAGQGLLQRFINYLEEDVLGEHAACERDGVRVISAGPNAFLYVVDRPDPLTLEELEARFPGLAARIARARGVGYVLARSAAGPVCFWRGVRHDLGDPASPLFAGREDADLARQGLADLMAMPSAGDLVIYGIGAPGGDVSFVAEVGAHAGPSREELQTFIVAPGGTGLPERVSHPLELYDHFRAYLAPAAQPVRHQGGA